MSKRKRIYNAKIVTPTKVIENGSLLIEGDTICQISEQEDVGLECEAIDANGSWLLPGIVDSHSDAIEMEMEPRPSSLFPIEISFYELEKKLVGQGITTIYHSLSLFEENAKRWIRQNGSVPNVIRDIKRLSKAQHLIRHKTHLRYEITNTSAVSIVKELIKENNVDQLSFMDHTPGQGQFRDLELHKTFLMEHRHYTEQEVDEFLNDVNKMERLDPTVLKEIAELAHHYHIPIASHDDDTVEKLALVKEWNATISEFPIKLEVAKQAKELGLFVVMGAPNAILGKSHSNNLSALEAIEHDVVDIFCSDYYPSSLLYTAFKLFEDGMPMHEAYKKVSLNPAKALKIDHEVGSIECGKKADLLIVSQHQNRPILNTVFVNGNIVCEMNYHTPAFVEQ